MLKGQISKTKIGVLVLLSVVGLYSCVRKEYDMNNLNTEVTIAQKGLALPLGSTKQIKISELLSQSGDNIISADENGISLCISDTMKLADQLPNFKEMFKFEGFDMRQSLKFEIGDFDAGNIAVDAIEISKDIDLDLDVNEEIGISKIAKEKTINMNLFALAKSIQMIDLTSTLGKTVIAEEITLNIPKIDATGSELVPLPLSKVNLANKPAEIQLEVNSPNKSITSIRDIRMKPSSRMVVQIKASNHSFINEGQIIPEISLRPGSLFRLSDDQGNTLDDAIRITKPLDKSNGFTSVTEFNLEQINYNGNPMTGSIMLSGVVGFADIMTSSNALLVFDGKIGIEVKISFKDAWIESAKFNLDDTSIKNDYDLPISLRNNLTLPDNIKQISQITFTPESRLSLNMKMENPVNGLNVVLKQLSVQIPEAITLASGSNSFNVYSQKFTDEYSKNFEFKALNLPLPIAGTNVVKWSDNISVAAEFVINGNGLNSADFAQTPEDDCTISSSMESDLEIEDWKAVIGTFENKFDSFKHTIQQTIDGDLSEFGTFIVTPQGNPKVNISIDIPSESVNPVPGNQGMLFRFPKFMKFKNVDSMYDYDVKENTICFTHNIPRKIELEIDKLYISPVRQDDGTSAISGEFDIEGSMVFNGGTVFGSMLKGADSKKSGITLSMPSIEAANVRLEEFKIDINEGFIATFIKAESIPSDLRISGLSEAIFDDVNAEFDIKVEGMPDFGEGRELMADFVVMFPEEISLDPSDKRVDGNKINITGTFEDGKLDIKPVSIKAIDLSDYDFASGEDLTMPVVLTGKIGVKNPEIGTSISGTNIKADINVKLDSIRFSKIRGKIEYDLSTDSQRFNIAGLPDILTEENFRLDIANAALKLKVRSNMGIPVKGSIEIVPVRNGNRDEDGKFSISLEINGAADASETDSVMIYVAGNQAGKPEGYSFIKNDKIKDLIKRIPDQLEINFNALTDGTKESVIQPDADYIFDVDYAFVCPLAFGEDFNITVRDTLKGIGENVGKILQQNPVVLSGEVENQLPLALEMEIDLLDSEGNVIPVENKPVQQIASCSADGEPVITALNISLHAGEVADLSDLSAILLSFTATSGDASNIQMDKDAYVQASLKMLLPEGLSIDLKDFGIGNKDSETDNNQPDSESGNGSNNGNDSDDNTGNDSDNGNGPDDNTGNDSETGK